MELVLVQTSESLCWCKPVGARAGSNKWELVLVQTSGSLCWCKPVGASAGSNKWELVLVLYLNLGIWTANFGMAIQNTS